MLTFATEPTIFISHIHEDKVAAAAIEEFLQAKLPSLTDKIFVSSNQELLILGDDWMQKIRRALDFCRIVLAVLSPESVTRPWVNFEAGAAWVNKEKALIPVCIGDLSPATLPKPYSNIQAVRLGPYPTEVDMLKSDAPWYLLDSIRKIMGEQGKTRLFSPFDKSLQVLNESLLRWADKLPTIEFDEEHAPA